MRAVRTLGLLGTGVIGGGWAARALHYGIDVIAADVNPAMEAWIRGAVSNAGNLRAFLFYDLIRRHLQLSGFAVNHVMNLTDIDDRILDQSDRYRAAKAL